jgi:hypothetical protein
MLAGVSLVLTSVTCVGWYYTTRGIGELMKPNTKWIEDDRRDLDENIFSGVYKLYSFDTQQSECRLGF